MKNIIFLFLLILFSSQSLISQTTPAYGIRDKFISIKAFVNATIIVSPTKTIKNGILVVKDGIIQYVGEAPNIPAEAYIIDLQGYTIYPGFIDPFSNYGVEKPIKAKRNKSRLQFEPNRIGGSASNNAIHADINWVDTFKPSQKESEEYFKAGFTVVQSARKDGIFRGRSFVTLLGKGTPNNLILKPYTSRYISFNKGSSPQENPSSLMGSIALIRQTFLDVMWYQSAHSAYNKNKSEKIPEFNSDIEAIANDNNQTFLFYTKDELSFIRANKIAQEFDLDFIFIGSGYEYNRIDDIKATSSSIILPLKFPKAPDVATIDVALDVTLADLPHWETAPYNPSILAEKNIPFAFTMPGKKDNKTFLKNLRKAIKHGLSESKALEALTIIPATMCGITDICGTLEKGKLANFFITDGNIFKEKKKIYSVWVNGEKNSLRIIPKIVYTGEYKLSFENHTGDLSLTPMKRDKSKLTGKLIIENDTLKLQNVTAIGDNLKFTVKSKSDSLSGVLRFSGRKENTIISGSVILPNGNKFIWTATSLTNTILTETEKDRKTEKELTRIANQTFPNKSYGIVTPPSQENLHIKNITIWTSEEAGILEDYDLIIKNGLIHKIGQSLKTPSSYRVIDGSGKHLTAGIIDEHSHIAISGGVNECTDAITAEVRIGDVLNPNDINIYRQLSGGVTTSHLLHGSCNAIGGQAQIIKLRWGLNADGIKFENAFPTIKFALGENVKRSGWGDKFKTRYPLTRMGIETIIRDEFQTALEYNKKWNTFNSLSSKTKKTTIPPRKDLELDAVYEVISAQRAIHCHSYVQTEILMLMRLAEQYDFHVQTFTHILEGYKVADEMAKHGATASGFSDWWAYKFEVYDAIPYNLALMSDKGVISSVNSDNADLARRLNQEAAKSIQYGNMTPEEAIKMATINPAIALKIDNRVGSIKTGKDADFVIWNNYPLSIYSKVEQTWIEGRNYFNLENNLQQRQKILLEKNTLIQKILSSPVDKDKSYKKDYKPEDKEYHCNDNSDYWRLINEAY